jgi:hypothetical protein
MDQDAVLVKVQEQEGDQENFCSSVVPFRWDLLKMAQT